MLISSLVQYNADANSLSSSIRLRWEYTGGSELFVVYSDGRNTLPQRIPRAAEPHVRHQGDAAREILDEGTSAYTKADLQPSRLCASASLAVARVLTSRRWLDALHLRF